MGKEKAVQSSFLMVQPVKPRVSRSDLGVQYVHNSGEIQYIIQEKLVLGGRTQNKCDS